MGDELGAVAKAAAGRARADERWLEAVRVAVAAGHSLRAVAKAAGVSHVRVLQITRGR